MARTKSAAVIPPSRGYRNGLTLVEILIAMVMTLIVLYAMMEAFRYASVEIKRGRAVIEMSNQLRSAQELFRSDLEAITLDPRPWTQTAQPTGYFEILEGAGRDSTNAVSPTDNYLGDVDDVIAFTVNRPERPFRGRYVDPGTGQTQIVESPMAEIVWWTDWDDRNGNSVIDFDEPVTLYRRVLLIRPDLDLPPLDPPPRDIKRDLVNFWKENDISARVDLVTDKIVANRLEDLGHRAARFCHYVAEDRNYVPPLLSGYPHRIDRMMLKDSRISANTLAGSTVFTGDDIVLTDLAGFDIQVYSPNARVAEALTNTLAVEPGDVGFGATPATNEGAFVDLNHGAGGWFSNVPHPKSGLSAPEDVSYDTWTPVYETDRIDQDGLNSLGIFVVGADTATNGIDDDNANGVDDTGERDTMPPYPHPVRGIKATFRMIEKDTRQVRQVSVVHSFVPE